MANDQNKYGIIDLLKLWLKKLDSSRDNKIKSIQDIQRQKYRDFLEDLAWNESSDIFSNGGIDYASILMSVLFQHTEKEARIYSIGFRPDLITSDPYWPALKTWLSDPKHELKVLVETDAFLHEEPLQLLQQIKVERNKHGINSTIIVKQISNDSRTDIIQKYGEPCNFAIFDNNKFRYEYDPEHFKAYGSFNQPENCRVLIDDFDNAFDASNAILI